MGGDFAFYVRIVCASEPSKSCKIKVDQEYLVLIILEDNNMIEVDKDFASKGVAGAGLGLGIAGTALGLLNGGIPGLFGNGWGANNCGCSEAMLVNRYEAGQAARIAELETEVKLRDANVYTMTEMGKLRDYVDRRFEGVNAQINAQAVYNATNTAALNCIQGQVAQLMDLTKLVVPNGSICPGWGDVTVSVTPAAAG
jgi:hypothetical protein